MDEASAALELISQTKARRIRLTDLAARDARGTTSTTIHQVHLPHVSEVSSVHAKCEWPLMVLTEDLSTPTRAGKISRRTEVEELQRIQGDWVVVSTTAIEICRHDLAGPALRPVEPAQATFRASTPPTLPESVAMLRLLDLEEIRQLKSRYFRLMDTKDWSAWGALFTDSAEFRIRDEVMSKTNWIRMVQEFLRTGVSLHQGHAPEITFTGENTAEGIWSLTDVLEWPGTSPRRAVLGHGHYQEQYSLSASGWQISGLTLSYLSFDHLPDDPGADSRPEPGQFSGWFDNCRPLSIESVKDISAIKNLRAASDGALTASARLNSDSIVVRHSHMPEIRMIDSDSALGLWCVSDHLHDATGGWEDALGYLDEVYRRVDGVWEIASSTTHYVRTDRVMSADHRGSEA